MLCSARELGLGRTHDGILELDTDAAPGTPLLEAVPLADHRLVRGRHPQPPRPARPQGRRARAGGVVRRAVPAAGDSRAPTTVDVPPVAARGHDRARSAASRSPSRTPSRCPRFHARADPRRHGRSLARLARARGSRRSACARSTTWWTRPTTSCSS